MTPILLASIVGAVLFFVAGAALMTLRRDGEVVRLREALAACERESDESHASFARERARAQARIRDLSTENEHLKGRVRDADGLRADYVRLRTAATESDFLRSEVARLERELREVRVNEFADRRTIPVARPARGSSRQLTVAEPTIGESLARAIERFADAGTRSSALADPQGFPLATIGADGHALAAYAAHLYESASRAKDYLPVSAPKSIEIVDANGVRVSLWSLDIETDRLVLANLAVSPVDPGRIEATLGDLIQILASSGAKRTATRAP
jgi:hypothetical protein